MLHEPITNAVPPKPSAIREASSLVVQAAALIERAETIIIGMVQYDGAERFPAEDGLQVAKLRDALDAYHLFIEQDVVPGVDRGLADAVRYYAGMAREARHV